MDNRVFQNMIYTSGKSLIVTKSNVFATNFDNIVNTANDLYNKGSVDKMYNALVRYFLSLNCMEVINNNFAEFSYNADLEDAIAESLKDLLKINSLTSVQIYILRCIKTIGDMSVKRLKEITIIDDALTIDVTSFILSYNNIIDKRDISSILNFIQINGLRDVYNTYNTEEHDGLLFVKPLMEAVNNKEVQKQFDTVALAESYVTLANSTDDKSFKQNCLFLSDEEIEFHTEDGSYILNKFKEQGIDLTINNKQYNTVAEVLSVILNDDMFILKLTDDVQKLLRKTFYDAIIKSIEGLKVKLGFPEKIQGNEYNAILLLNMVLNKKPGVGKTYLEMIEIVFREDNIDFFKTVGIYEDLVWYDGLYEDFKDIFDKDIAPASDTGYRMTNDVKLFWESGLKLYERVNEENNLNMDIILPAFSEFGKVVFNCSDYMISLKMLFTVLNNVTEDRPNLLVFLCSLVSADRLFDKIGKFL